MLSSVARDAAYAAALARVAELEAWQEVSLTMAEETHEVMDVVATQRDTALAELAVLRAALEQIARGPDDPRNYPARDTSIESHYEIVASRALTALHEAEQEGFQAGMAERDALDAELAELREAVPSLVAAFEAWDNLPPLSLGKSVAGGPFFAALVKLNNLAAQPQGDRGRALLAELEQYRELLQAWRAFWRQRHSTNELIAMEPYIGPRTELGMRFAAIDGAQS